MLRFVHLFVNLFIHSVNVHSTSNTCEHILNLVDHQLTLNHDIFNAYRQGSIHGCHIRIVMVLPDQRVNRTESFPPKGIENIAPLPQYLDSGGKQSRENKQNQVLRESSALTRWRDGWYSQQRQYLQRTLNVCRCGGHNR